jgi:protein SCO1/2
LLVSRPAACARLLTATLLLAGLGVAACGSNEPESASCTDDSPIRITREETGFHGTLVRPPVTRPALALPDTAGQTFDFRARPSDEITVVFFGYTHCPDVCPTTMADLAAAYRHLDAGVRDRITVVFVTEDPERDTPKVVRRWLDRFDPTFVGLVGGNEQTRRALNELHLPQTTRNPSPTPAVSHPPGHDHGDHDHDDYGVDHSGVVYAFGPGGRTVLYTGGTTPTQYAADFSRLAR